MVTALFVGAAAPLDAQSGDRRLPVRNLDIEGNRAIDDFTLRASIRTTESAWLARQWYTRWVGWGARPLFDETEFRRDVLRLWLLYRQSGYVDARVDTTVTRRPDHVDIRLVITEGEPVRVASLTLTGTEGIVRPAQLLRDLPLQEGDAFDQALLVVSSDSIQGALQNRGYPFPRVYRGFSVRYAERRAEVEFVVDPGPAARIDTVRVIGPEDLDESLVRETLRVQPGQPFNRSLLYQSQQELYRMGVFDFVDVRLADSLPGGPDDSLVAVVAQVSRGRLHSIRTGVGYGTNDCFRTLSSWTGRNFLGGGRSLALTAGFSKIGTGDPFDAGFEENICRSLAPDAGTERLDLNYNLSASVRFPTVFSPRRSATVTATAERFSEFQAYIRQAIGFGVFVTQQTKWNIPITLLLLVRDRTNSPINPTRGTVLTLEARIAAEEIGSDPEIEFAKGLAEFSSYHPVGRQTVFAWRLRWGSIRSPDLQFEEQDLRYIPTEERFYGGGPTSVRGFRQNELGPVVHVDEVTFLLDSAGQVVDSLPRDSSDIVVSPTGGNTAFIANAELRFPLSRSGRLAGVVFVDLGRVQDRPTADADPGFRVTPGAGLRVFTPLGPVRLDVAYNHHGPEKGQLFRRECTLAGRVLECLDAELIQEDFVRPQGSGIFGLRNLRLNFSIGQAF
jgi:outer membrane protein assembly complex protein YaeT